MSEPGWHPDPTGRHEQRWWDGERWTEAVSTAGVGQVDAEGAQPAEPDRSVLQHATLTVDFGATGLSGDGSWWVRQRDTAEPLGQVLVDHAARTLGAAFVVQDLAGRAVLRLARVGTLRPDLAVLDHLGRELGRIRTRGAQLELLAPLPAGGGAPGALGLWATAQLEGVRATRGALAGALGGEQPAQARVVLPDGHPVALLQVLRPLSSFVRDRDPAMPDPLRTLVFAAVGAVALVISDLRASSNRRRRLE